MGAPAALQSTPRSKPLVFALNGQRVEPSSVDPATTLLSYIRSETRFKGPKRGCGEGGCGACVVMLGRYNPETKEVKESTVNACLVMLCSVDGCAITTTEGLCEARSGFHAVHKRISAFHGSQCGFCTPGMSMAIYGCLKDDQQRSGGLTKPTAEKLERALQGNICRCTGYRPLLDVCKSFASDVDLEDLGLDTCWSSKAGAKEENLPRYDPKSDPQFPQFLIDELDAATTEESAFDARFTHVERSKEGESTRAWVSATTLADLSAALEALRGRNQKTKLVVGNTSAGYYKDLRQVDVFVDISQIPELLAVRRDAGGLELGAATRIAEVIDYLEEWPHSPVAQPLADHLKKLAGGHVRNWGSVGGNLVMVQKFSFPSDVAAILLGAGASVTVVTLTGSSPRAAELPLEEFLGTKLGNKSILQSVYIPLAAESTVFKTFRGAPRPYGNAVASANAAFLVQISRSAQIQSARLAFGAFGTKHAIRASRTEELLRGRSLTLGLVKEAVEVVKTEVVPLDGTTTKEYRISLAVGFLFDFLNSLLSGAPTVTPHLFPHIGKQEFTFGDEHYPLSQPTSKFLSQNQASGEAVYVDDIPSPPGCLHAAFVLSSEPYAEIRGVDTSSALGSVGAVAYVSAADIPGRNVGIINPYNQELEPLFADEVVGFVGHPLGVMVADTYDNARIAAGKVTVNYDTRSVGPPIMTCDDAVAKNSLFSVPPMFLQDAPIVDVEKGLAAAEFTSSATVSTKSQSHFYMETQTDLAISDEDGCITIYTASQGIDSVQQVIDAVLDIPIHNVRVITHRLGGGFGGKGFRNQQIAAAIALAAYTLRRLVRVSLDRNTDMQMVGGRFLTQTNYTVGFTKTGKITALKAEVLMEAGWFVDGTNVLPMTLSSSLKKYNYGSMKVDYTLCKTNNVPKTAMRAPGDCEGSAIADAILDHVASHLGISGNKVRDENLHIWESVGLFHGEAVGDASGFTLPVMWDRLKSCVDILEREKEIEAFNERNRWIKRGLAMVTCTFHALSIGNMATLSVFQDGSIVVEVGGVEMGQGLYTKVRQAVAYSLSPLWNKRLVSLH